MRNRLIATLVSALLAVGCATGGSGLSPAGSAASGTSAPPPNVDANCDAIQPLHTPDCDRLRAQADDIDDQIAALRQSLEGPPLPTGPERAGIMQRIRDLETQKSGLGSRLATCSGRNRPRRQSTPNVESVLTQVGNVPAGTLTTSPPGLPGLPPPGEFLTQSLSGQEFVLRFTQGGCTVEVLAIPGGKFKKTHVSRDFSLGVVDMVKSGGTYHPGTGDLDLHIETTLTPDFGMGDPIAFDLTTRSGGGRPVDAAGNLVLVSPAPVRLDPRGHILPAIGVEEVSFRFEGLLDPHPPR